MENRRNVAPGVQFVIVGRLPRRPCVYYNIGDDMRQAGSRSAVLTPLKARQIQRMRWNEKAYTYDEAAVPRMDVSLCG